MKKLLATMLALVMALTLCTAAWADEPSWYAGNVAVFELDSAEELVQLAAIVNRDDGDEFSGKTVKLTANIDLSSVATWTAIGNGTRDNSGYTGKAFKGTFDGNGYTISGVTGMLFGVLDGGMIQNLKVVANINDTTNDSVGAVAGIVVGDGTVSGITVSGSVVGNKTGDKTSVGGVVGRMMISGTVTNCTNTADVSTTTEDKAGGIVGAAYYTATDKTMTISGCSNSGAVSSGYAAGGIVGLSAADVKNCTNTGNITAGNEAGGIAGEQTNRGVVSGNNNSGAISNSGAGSSYGGIVGWVRYQNNDSAYPNTAMIEVSNNTNSGTVSASGASLGAGGIVGTVYNQASVTGNTNTAASIAGGTFAAGIVGGAQSENDNKKIDGKTITVSDNVSTTSIENIRVSSGECKHLYMWNNQPETFVEENNVGYVSYTVTFVDGETVYDTKTVASGSTVTAPETNPTKDGYVFEHWCLSTGDTHTAFDFENTKIDSNITLKAHWTAQSSGGTHHIYRPQPTTDTTETKAESPKTFDAGVAVYGLMAVSSVLGMGVVGKKKF